MNLIELLQNQRRGRALAKANEKLAEVVRACRETGKKGELVITLKIKPKANEMWVDDDVTPKIPKKDQNASVFFDDLDGRLLQDDPNQRELTFATLPNPDTQAAS